MTTHGDEAVTATSCDKANSSLDAVGGLTGWIEPSLATASTTNANATACGGVVLGVDAAYYIEAVVTFGEIAGASRGAFKLACTAYQTMAGGAVLQGAVTSIHAQSSSAATATLVVNGGAVEVQVTGVAATNLEWTSKISFLDITS